MKTNAAPPLGAGQTNNQTRQGDQGQNSSEFPALAGPERWPTNGDLIAELAASVLPYVDLDEPILDVTYGRGVFWSVCEPKHLVTNDLDPACGADHHWDFRTPPPEEWVGRFAAVVFDPPYKLSGTDRVMLQQYGLGDNATATARADALLVGTVNASRCVAPEGYLLVKCMAQVSSGKVRWQPRRVANLLEDRGWEIVDEILLATRPRPQPPGRGQKHARRNYSSLVIGKAPR